MLEAKSPNVVQKKEKLQKTLVIKCNGCVYVHIHAIFLALFKSWPYCLVQNVTYAADESII